MFYRKKRKTLGFTLIEVMISLFLSVMVAFFVYTMMISSYNVYRKLSTVSKNANSIRFFISSIEKSVRYAHGTPTISETEFRFDTFDGNRNCMITERYFFDGGGTFKENYGVSTSTTALAAATDYYRANSGKKLGLLKKEIRIKSDDRVVETVVVSNVIRTIYYSKDEASTLVFKRLNLGVVYDNVVDGSQDDDGKIVFGGETEYNTDATIERRLYCFRYMNR